VLREEGYEVQGAADGADALWRARRWHPDVIVLDLVMPTMNGWTFAETYRQEATSPAPIIAMTAAAGGARQAAEAIGASDVLVKPFDFEHMLEMIAIYTRYANQRGAEESGAA
jgi:CheY-like chemotaxis protein